MILSITTAPLSAIDFVHVSTGVSVLQNFPTPIPYDPVIMKYSILLGAGVIAYVFGREA